MLDEALILQKGLQTRGKYNFTAFTSQGETNKVDEKQVEQNQNNWKQSILPVCVMGGGAVLMYLGFKSPTIAEQIQNLYQKKVTNMTQCIANYKNYAETYLDKEYKKIIPYLKSFKKEHAFESLDYTARIHDAKNGSEVLATIDEAFTTMNGIRAKDIKAGGNQMDEFKTHVYQINHPAYEDLTRIRKGISLKFLDESIMPRFRNNAHKETIVELEEKLGKIKVRADQKLFDVQNITTDEHINYVSKIMARYILNSRENLQKSSNDIMEYSYNRIANIYNLDGEFKPLFKTNRSLQGYNQLKQENLSPQKLSQNASNIINNEYIQNLLEKLDFNNIDEKTTKTLFESIPITLDTKQMDMITDRIKLQQIVNKAEGKPEDAELQTLSAKLEYITDKLETYGKKVLMERCGQDFSNLDRQQTHAKLYYILFAARRIGMKGLKDVDKFMIEQKPEYLDSTFKQSLNGILKQPEHYFM